MINIKHISRGLAAVLVIAGTCAIFALPALASEEILTKAAAEIKVRNYLKARDLYRDAFIAAKSGPLADQALLGIARSDYLLKNYSEAALNLKRYVANQNAADRDEALTMLGYAYLLQHKLTDADRTFSSVGGEYASKALVGRAAIALQNQQPAAAESLFARVDKRFAETDNRAIAVQAMLLARKGLGEQAVAAIDRIPAPALRDEDLRVERAEVYLVAGKAKEAETMLRSFIQNPSGRLEQVRARRVLLRAVEVQGKQDEVLSIALELLSYDPNDDVRRKVIAIYDRKGDLENCLKQASQLKDRGIRSLEIEKRLKKVIEDDTAQSVDLVQRFAYHLHQDSPVLAQAAAYLAKKGKKAEGRVLLQRAVKGSASSDASLALAEIYIQEGRYDEAQKLLQPLMGGKASGQSALLLLGDIAERKGDTKAAIDLLQKAVKQGKQGKLARVEMRLGDLYWQSGDKTAALKYFSAAADAGEIDAMIKLADAHYLGGQARLAEKFYKKALDKKPADPKQMQWIQYQYGKISQKREYIEKAAAGGGEIGEAARMYLNR